MIFYNLLLVIAIFFSSLVNHGNAKFIPVLLIILLINPRNYTYKNMLCLIAGGGLITASAIYFNLYGFLDVHPEKVEAFWGNYFSYLALIMFIVMYIQIASNKNIYSKLYNAIKYVIIVHVLIITLQGIVFYTTGTYIDFVEPFTGEASRYENYLESASFAKIRFTGLYVEPSTYAAAIVTLVLTKSILATQLNKGNDYFDYIALLSAILTFSSASIIYANIAILYLIYTTVLNSKLKSLALIAVSMILCGTFFIFRNEIFQIAIDTVTKFQERGGMRLGLIHYIFSEREGFIYWFGPNIFGLEKELYILTHNLNNGPRLMGAENDSGLFVYFVVMFGVFSIIPLLATFLFILNKKKQLSIPFVIVGLTKISFMHYVFWIFIITLIYSLNAKKINDD